jgi:hypothetical protein
MVKNTVGNRGRSKLTKGHREEKWDAIPKGHKEKGI